MDRIYNMGRASVELKSIIPVAVSPNIASIGGFSVIDKITGKIIVFDWLESNGGSNNDDMKDSNNTLEMEWDLRNFDYHFFETQPDVTSDIYITQERINELIELDNQDKLEEYLTICEIDEVHYECYIGNNEEVHIPMKLVDFSIGNFDFSKEIINNYNKKISSEELDTQLRQTKGYFDELKKELVIELTDKVYIVNELTILTDNQFEVFNTSNCICKTIEEAKKCALSLIAIASVQFNNAEVEIREDELHYQVSRCDDYDRIEVSIDELEL